MPPHNPNDKWLISPKLSLANSPSIDFWVQTYNTNYGFEMFNVAVSATDNNPASFTKINQATESAPAVWTRKAYSLGDYANQDVYIGIQCVSNDVFVFMIDDISINSVLGVPEEESNNSLSVYPNPASDHVFLKSAQNDGEELTIVLLNTLGETLKTFREKDTQLIRLDISDVSQGIYYLHLRKGKSEYFRKISILR